jgi:hypothetical protein
MTVHLPFRHRRVQCRCCRRSFAARAPECPHCGHARKPRFAHNAKRNPQKLHGKSSRLPLRFMIVLVLVVMVVGGYMLVRETGLDARVKALSSGRWISHAGMHYDIDRTFARQMPGSGMKTATS